MKPLAVIKIGGTSLLEAASNVPQLSKKLNIVILHGAGKQIDEALARRGIKTRKIKGLRVTGKEALSVVISEMRKANNLVVSEIRKHGARAEPVGNAFKAKKKSGQLGYVGEITSVNSSGIRRCLEEGKIPVVMPIGYSGKQDYNINADTAARALVLKLKPDKLILLNEEGGVKGSKGKIIERIKSAGMDKLFKDGTVTGGMRLKLEEARELLKALDVEIIICSAKELGRDMSGTKVTR